MAGYIERITGLIPHTNKTVDIPLGGKSLIITGANGSGKTSLLRNAYEKTIVLIVNKKMGDLLLLRKRMSEVLSVLNDSSKIGTAVYDSAMRQRGQYQQALETLENGLQISIPQNAQFSSKYENRQAQVLYFQDMRLSEIAEAKYAQGLQNVIDENRRAGYDQNVGSKLEQHLVNLRTRRALAIAEDYDQALADAIENWFYQFEKNLKYLFQDDSLRLFFNSNKNKFSIELKDNPPFTFQTLSAGYRAVLDIYADLLMRTEYFSISPTALEGVVFIDEAEAHLHISLQRLILPFFVDSFPKIQFIVTTNSPYVLTSVRDILVFDLGKEAPCSISQVKSQNEILSEYLGVSTSKPVWTERNLAAILDKYLNQEPDDISLDALKEELTNAGLEEYIPDAMAKVLGREEGDES